MPSRKLANIALSNNYTAPYDHCRRDILAQISMGHREGDRLDHMRTLQEHLINLPR